MASTVQEAIDAVCSAARALPATDAPFQQMVALGIERGKYDATQTIREKLATAVTFLEPFRDAALTQTLLELPTLLANSLVHDIETLRIISDEIVVRCQRQTTAVVPPSYHGAESGVARQIEDIHTRLYERLAPLRRTASNIITDLASTTGGQANSVKTVPAVNPLTGIAGAFFSYARFNDEHDDGRVSEFCDRLGGEVRAQTGDPFEMWQDRRAIGWGEQWRKRIEEGLDAATLLIVVITPSWFKSLPCREEVDRFRALERARGRADLILPVVYIDTPQLNDPNDPVAVDLRQRQFFRIDDLRNSKWIKANIGRRIEAMAIAIRDVLKRIGSDAEHARRAREAEQAARTGSYPFAIGIPGQPGFVRSPYSPDKITDVTGYAPSTMVCDPYTDRVFLVPDPRDVQPKVTEGLPADPANPGWVHGWGIYRLDPWHLFGVSASRIDADAMGRAAGDEYAVAFGSHRLGSDDFIESYSQVRG